VNVPFRHSPTPRPIVPRLERGVPSVAQENARRCVDTMREGGTVSLMARIRALEV